ncbi:MAG TPA: hypothetical protein VG844_05535 [Terracidiphilus sp.]|nr:hypothetical protein [Terracidiphilus sp.]
MKIKRHLFAVAFAVLGVALASTVAKAQVSINVQIGPQPVCPYGYFDYAPYQCAPFGYYGPTWFTNGIFVGAGPWFHGPVGFRGYIDRRYDPRYGYHGPFPRRGMRADWGRHRGWEHNWHGSEMREEHRHDNGNHNGHYKEHGNPHSDHGHGNPHGDHEHGHGRG